MKNLIIKIFFYTTDNFKKKLLGSIRYEFIN